MRRLRWMIYRMKQNGNLPIVTLVLFVLNLACFIWEATQGSTESTGNPVTWQFCMYQGAIGEGEWYRVFTHAFFHYGLLHIACNMFCLWMYGLSLETRIGSLKYAAIYLVSIIGSGVLVNFTGGMETTGYRITVYAHAGASGAVWGLMCAMLVYCIRHHLDITYSLRGIILNLIYSFSASSVSWQGHIGGGVAGLIIALFLCGDTKNRRLRAYQRAYMEGKQEADRKWRDGQDG